MPRLLLVRTLCLPLLASLLLPMTSGAQDTPGVTVANLAQRQFAQDFLQQAQAKEAEQARARAAAAPNAPKDAKPASPDKTPAIEMTVAAPELNRFAVDIKGELLKSGLYRIFPGKVYSSTGKETVADINTQIANGQYPDADYVLFGTISYVNTNMVSAPAGNKQTSHTFSMDVVGEFVLINVHTRAVDVAFSAIGQGSDMHVSRTAGSVIAINKSKILKEVSQSLASAVAGELAFQLKPGKIKAGTTPRAPAVKRELTRTLTIK